MAAKSRRKSARGTKLPSPMPIIEDQWAAWRTYALGAAFELDVFTHIASGAANAEAVAATANANPASMRRLLDVMVATGHLRRKGDKYSLTSHAETYLVRGGPLYAENSQMFARSLAMTWANLADAVRNGRPITPPNDGGQAAREFFRMLVRAIFPQSYVAAKAAVAGIPKRRRDKIVAILDVAAGSGAWSLAFAEAIPTARVTVVDFPEIASVTREYATRYGVAERYDYLEGDLRQLDFGNSRYDLVILGHIIHGEGREHGRRLIERSAAALRDRGLLLIAEMVPRDDRTGPAMPMLFGINMMLSVAGGDVFTMAEYREWLKAAGFKTIRTIRAPAPSPLILAGK